MKARLVSGSAALAAAVVTLAAATASVIDNQYVNAAG